MAAIISFQEQVHLASGGTDGNPQVINFFKSDRIAGATATNPQQGRETSMWLVDGNPSAGTAPGAVAIPTNATTGALKQASPGGGRILKLLSLDSGGLAAWHLVFYDRLLHQSNLDGTSTSAQTVGGTITRHTDGLGNEIFAEIYTQIGSTARTITASYTNQDGTPGRTTQAVTFGGTGNREIQRMVKLPFQEGDYGVIEVASVTIAGGSTGTAGAFGVTIAHQLGCVSAPLPGLHAFRWFHSGMLQIPEPGDDACIALFTVPMLAAPPYFLGTACFVEK